MALTADCGLAQLVFRRAVTFRHTSSGSPNTTIFPALLSTQTPVMQIRWRCRGGKGGLCPPPPPPPHTHTHPKFFPPSCIEFSFQNSPYFGVFKYARTVKLKEWNETGNGRLTFRLTRLARSAWDFYATLKRFEKTSDHCFAVFIEFCNSGQLKRSGQQINRWAAFFVQIMEVLKVQSKK